MADEHILGQNIITALGITRLSDDIKVRLLDKMAALAEKISCCLTAGVKHDIIKLKSLID